ncbi:NADH:ubiquinone reductase (Na(+)-transporting) subunit B [bacterium]|nr:NADH:ubiquinone reductase (Na(+)-transporting) subunit B [candidate division CSSED10-310 bacterium]
MTSKKNLGEKIRSLWEEGGRFHKYWPLFEAFDTFLFSLGTRTSRAPHVRDSLDLKRVMTIVIYALVPATCFGIYNIGVQSRMAHGLEPDFLLSVWTGLLVFVPLLIISYGVGMFWEIVFSVIRREEVSEGYLVTGLLIPLIVPPTIPWWQLVVAITFAVILGKEVFGGTGMNVVNPALAARAFLFFAYPAQISGDGVWFKLVKGRAVVDAFTGATPLALGAASKDMGLTAADAITRQYSFMDSFLGFIPGSIGETSKLAILIGAALLIYSGVASWKIMVGCLAGLCGTTWIMNLLAGPDSTGMTTLSPLHHLLLGGFLFGVVFMATDPVSSPETSSGKWVYGILIGVMTATIRVINPAYPEGTMLAILLLNVFAPLIDYVALRINIRSRRLRYAQ